MKFQIGDTIHNVNQTTGEWAVADIVDYKGMTPADSGKAYKLVDKDGQVTFLLIKHEDTMETASNRRQDRFKGL